MTSRLEEIERELVNFEGWGSERASIRTADIRYLFDEVAWLREMIQYAIDGPDVDLPEQLGGRAVDGCKKILRDLLSGKCRPS